MNPTKKTAVDLQVNGGPAISQTFVDFSVPGLTPELVLETTHRWAELGTGAYLPTVITTAPGVYETSLPAIAAAMDRPGGQGIFGIHVEGPFLSKIAKGAHNPEHMRPPTIDGFKRMQDLANGRIVLMTLAPEHDGALQLIEHLVENGVTVSIGHSDLLRPQFEDAVKAGARLVTHVSNGLPSTVNRAALKDVWRRMVIEQLLEVFTVKGILDDKVAALIKAAGADPAVVDLIHSYLTEIQVTPMIIPDGCHITDDFIQVVAAARGVENVIITSDAAPVARAPAGNYSVFGHLPVKVVFEEERRPEVLPLCGSYWSAVDCVNVFAATVDRLTEAEAYRICKDNPLTAITPGLNRLGIDPSKRTLHVGSDLCWNAAEVKFEITE